MELTIRCKSQMFMLQDDALRVICSPLRYFEKIPSRNYEEYRPKYSKPTQPGQDKPVEVQ